MSSQLLDDQPVVSQRECIHRSQDVSGRFYPGEIFIKALQSLRGAAAMSLSRKVGPFFWSDAAHTKVWLCDECAREARL
jgi:hypothetical protein